VTPQWSSPMITHPAQVAPLATRLAEALYAPLAQGRLRRVTLVHALPWEGGGESIAQSHLIPFDYARFSVPANSVPPLVNIPPEDLLARLVDEYLFAEISEALVLSLAAENEARVRAMIAAHGNISRSLDELTGTARRLRQEAITDEIVELAGGGAAAGRR